MNRQRFSGDVLSRFGIIAALAFAMGAPAGAVPVARFATATASTSVTGPMSFARLFAFADDAGGAAPRGAPIPDAAGNLFGVAAGDAVACGQGQPGACGLIFKLSPVGNRYSESVLFDFAAAFANGQPASVVPNGTLAVGPGGVLYGSTFLGGANGYGSVYSLAPSASGYVARDLYDFTGTVDGAGPTGALIVDATGALYGTTQTTAFKLTPGPQKYAETTLHTFGLAIGDGAGPGPLVANNVGTLFGTTSSGGPRPCTTNSSISPSGCGTLFALVPTASGYVEHILYTFTGGRYGSYPTSTIVRDRFNALYGTTQTDGDPNCSCGVVFKYVQAPGGNAYSVLYAFGGTARHGDGADPVPLGGLVGDGAGKLYGETTLGGLANRGTIFELAPTSQGYAESILHRFTNHAGDLGPGPSGSLAVGPHGGLYGMTSAGGVGPCFFGNGCGVVFKIWP
jgi:hypothetical protein